MSNATMTELTLRTTNHGVDNGPIDVPGVPYRPGFATTFRITFQAANRTLACLYPSYEADLWSDAGGEEWLHRPDGSWHSPTRAASGRSSEAVEV